jgi:glycosyltransferase involved in cell wall biosynthesis
MKICLLCYRGNRYCGGQGIYLYYLSRELVRQGHEVDVMVGPPYADVPDGAREFRLESLNLYDRRHDGRSPLHGRKPYGLLSPFNLFEFGGNKLGMFPEMLTFSLRAYRQIYELLPAHRYDVIHDNQCLAYGLLLMKSLGIPVVATVHHPLPIDTRADLAQESNPWKRFRQLLLYPPLMQGIVARRLDAVITDSDSSIHEIEQAFRVPRSRMRRAYLGIDTEMFRNVDGHRSVDVAGSRQWRLIMVGRTSDRKKGILYLLRALRLLKNDRVPVRLSIVDEIEKNDTYAADLVAEYGIGDMVEFTGRLLPEELVRKYSESDIAVTASVYEGFGLPAAEAMACGVPVVATDTGALPEVVGRDGCCLLVPPKDPQALAEAIKRLIGDEELRRRMGIAGRQRIETLFSWERAAKQIVEVYREAIG